MIGLLALGVGLLAVAVLAVALTEVLIRRADIGAGLVLGATVLNAVLLDQVPALTFRAACGSRCTTSCSPCCWRRAPFGCCACDASPASNAASSCWRCCCCCPWRGERRRSASSTAWPSPACTCRSSAPPSTSPRFPPSNALNDRIGKLWLAMSIPMMVLVCLRWLAVFGGIDVGVPAAEFGADAAVKVIDGPYTFFLACAVVLTVPYWPLRGPRARRLTLLGAVLLLFVVLLNRRTVWLALLAGVAVVMLRERRLGPRAAMLVATVALVTVGLYLALPGAAGTGPGTEPVAQSATGTGTLEWRIQGWSELYAGWSTDPTHWVIGQPFGTGFARNVLGSEVQAEPHNFYFSTLLRMGLVGVLSLIALTGGLLRALWRIPDPRRRPARARTVPGAAGHAGHLVHHLGARPGAGDHHRSRRGPCGRACPRGTAGLSPRRPMDDPGVRRPASGRHDHRPGTGRIRPAPAFPPGSGVDARSRPAHLPWGDIDDHASHEGLLGASSARGRTGRPLGGKERPASPPVPGRLLPAGR